MSSDEKLVQMTIRVPQEIKNLIVEEATKQSCSSSEVVRNSVLSNLSGYYDDVEYIDAEQGAIVIDTVKNIFTEIHNIKNQLQDSQRQNGNFCLCGNNSYSCNNTPCEHRRK